MKELILGYGVTGRQLASYLTIDRDPDLFFYDNDLALQREWRELPDHQHQFYLRTLPDRQQLESYDMIYVSPGFNLKKLYPKGEFEDIPFKTDLDIFLEKNDSFKIGITGTNGKSTCCYHLSQILEDSQVMGNFGNGVLHYCYTPQKYSIIEISSFQLEKMKEIKLDLGVLLNVDPDHIDHHGSYEEYKRVKNRIKEAKVFTEESDPWELLFLINGEHPKRKELNNLPHRFEEFSQNIKGISAINDSKSTNLASLEFALDKMSHPYYLFLCGDPSKEEYKNHKILGPQKIIIFGKHARDIYKRVSHPKKILLHNQGLQAAISSIRFDHPRVSTLLFSPGHPSGKDYRNFEDRGNHFKELVQHFYNDS